MTRIAVDQSPSGGSNYPLRFEHELASTLLDLFLSYDDGLCEFVYPFRIVWMYGFGDTLTTPVGYTPTHDRDVVIVDDEGTVVFDSTTGDFQENSWGADRTVSEWYVDAMVLRIVWLTDNDLDDYVMPTDALLDPRTYVRSPERVRGILVNGQLLDGDVDFESGYNVSMLVDEQDRVDGGEFVERIQLDGVVGAGDGRLPGCDEVEPQVRRFNGIGPDAAGNFTIETDGCIRQQLLLSRSGTYFDYTAEYAATGMTSDEAASALKLDDDCQPCCPCDAYVFTYRGITRVWDKWATVAAELEEVRDLYSENVDRWNAQRDCRIAEPFKLTASSQPGSTTFIGANFCNLSHCCLAPVEIRFTVIRYADGVEASPPVVVIKEAYVSGAGINGEVAYAPQVLGNVVIFRFDAADPQKTTSIRFRFCYDAEVGDSLSVAGSVHYPDPPPNDFGETCIPPTPTVPPAFDTLWGGLSVPVDTMRAIAYRAAPVNLTAPSYPCTNCDCS